MKLWNDKADIDAAIERFTVGRDDVLDLELARYDVQGSRAHAQMLAEIGILSAEELAGLLRELSAIGEDVEAGRFAIEPGVEDVHSQVEKLLTERLGDAGKKLHTARSRNDQVLVDLRLYFRAQLDELAVGLEALARSFGERSEATKDHLMPGFTHMQVGMVSSFGLWFGCFAEALADDRRQVRVTRTLINQNPLGSAAGYGSAFAIDRDRTTELLGFDGLCVNAMYAQFGRGKTELLVAQALASVAFTLSKFAYDACLFSSQNYGLVKLPDALTTGSSIMPHKKNPDVFELIRARCNQLQSLPTQILMVTQNLPSGYHRDFQQLKEIVFPAFATLRDIVGILAYVLPRIEVAEEALADARYDALFSVDNMAGLVQQGVPLRDAYHRVKAEIADGTFVPARNAQHTHLGSIGNLGTERVMGKLGD